jgi:predicted RNase H-like HicB family nuclease
MTRNYVVIIEQGPTSYGAYVPDLPDCVAVGETKGEAIVLLHVESLQEDGQPVPDPRSHSKAVAVATT